jgi:hypothetical protein
MNTILRVEKIILWRFNVKDTWEEPIPHANLGNRRKVLCLMIYGFNIPLFLAKVYEIIVKVQQGVPISSSILLLDLVLTASLLVMIIYLPTLLPVFASSYWFTKDGIKISRLLKKTLTLPYRAISKIEIYEKSKRGGEIPKKITRYAKESINNLRDVGFRLHDYSNYDDCITILLSGEKIYLISPSSPRVFAQKVQKRANKIPIQMVEITSKGERKRPF